jgi:hypothetical protein
MKKPAYHVGMASKSGLHMIQKGSMVHAPTEIMDDEAAEGESMGGKPMVNKPVASKSKISSKPKEGHWQKAKKKKSWLLRILGELALRILFNQDLHLSTFPLSTCQQVYRDQAQRPRTECPER